MFGAEKKRLRVENKRLKDQVVSLKGQIDELEKDRDRLYKELHPNSGKGPRIVSSGRSLRQASSPALQRRHRSVSGDGNNDCCDMVEEMVGMAADVAMVGMAATAFMGSDSFAEECAPVDVACDPPFRDSPSCSAQESSRESCSCDDSYSSCADDGGCDE